MILSIKVVPNARQEKLVRQAAGCKVYLCAPAVDGKANARLAEFLAERLGVKRRDVAILRGHISRQKQVEISGVSIMPDSAFDV